MRIAAIGSVLVRVAPRALTLSLAITACSALLFRAAMQLRRPARISTFVVLLAMVISSPLLVPPGARFLRLLATLASVTTSIKLYDHLRSAEAGFFPSFWLYCTSLINPYAHVLRQAVRTNPPPLRSEILQTVACLSGGLAAVALEVGVFHINWRRHGFVFEHSAKAISVFLMVQFLPNALVPAYRLVGIPATNFAGPFFLARTPADFWRLYNRPVRQFFTEYVFKPAGGFGHPIRGTFLTFVVSGIVHEYVFDIPAGRVLGTQMLFFMIQGLAVIATIRLRPRGWAAVLMILLTFAFNLATVRLFLAGLNVAVPLYVDRSR
jgi:hypothetical protein